VRTPVTPAGAGWLTPGTMREWAGRRNSLMMDLWQPVQ
jgi:hypothetical protein